MFNYEAEKSRAVPRLLLFLEERILLRLSPTWSSLPRIHYQASDIAEIRMPRVYWTGIDATGCRSCRVISENEKQITRKIEVEKRLYKNFCDFITGEPSTDSTLNLLRLLFRSRTSILSNFIGNNILKNENLDILLVCQNSTNPCK